MQKQYRIDKRQYCGGEAIGILLLEASLPFIPGDVANATSYPFPVSFEVVEGYTTQKALSGDKTILPALLQAIDNLEKRGVRAITGDCGFMLHHQEGLQKEVTIPLFLSSLLQLPFMQATLPPDQKVGIITASKRSLGIDLLQKVGGVDLNRICIRGLDHATHFNEVVIGEGTILNTEKLTAEVLRLALDLQNAHTVGAILLECSVLPPYAHIIARETGLPVFDYNTMIHHMYKSLVPQRYQGYL